MVLRVSKFLSADCHCCKNGAEAEAVDASKKHAVATLHSQFFPSVTDKKLTVVRSARHSKFPECTDCQKLRCEYKKLAANPKASEIQVAAAWQRMTNHANQWQRDRETAIDLRHRYSINTSRWRYSVDDKCRSFWHAMPVSFSGRDTKENAKDKYRFSVHTHARGGVTVHRVDPKNRGRKLKVEF